MKRKQALGRLSLLAALLIAATPAFPQDSVTTLAGLRVEGKIGKETEEEVFIETRFGELRFLKMDLKSISRGSGGGGGAAPWGSSAAAPAGNANPFSFNAPPPPPAQPPAGGNPANPFAMGPGGPAAPPPAGASTGSVPVNPFAAPAGQPQPPPAPAGNAPVNPFAAPAGGAPPQAGNPFAAAPPAPQPATGGNPFAAPPGDTTNPFAQYMTTPPETGAAPVAPPAAPSTGGERGFGGYGVPVGAPPAGGNGAAAPTNPFGGAPAAPAGNPFAPGPAEPAPASGTNPFEMGPQSQLLKEDPVGEREYAFALSSPRVVGKSETEAAATATPVVRRAVFQPRKELPVVQTGFDAVVFGMTREAPVQIRRPDAEWGAASEDTQLATGSEVRTEEAATSRMLLRGKRDEIRLPEKSHIEIERLSDDSEEVVIALKSGSVWTEVQPRSEPDSFRVRTPELTAGVRGTVFRVDRAEGASKVSVFEGVVHVTANATGASVTLNANQAAVVNVHGQIMDLLAVPVDEQRIADEWDQWAQQASGGSGSLAASFGPVAGLTQQIATDNARWEAEMQEYARNVAELRYQEKLDEYAAAFLRFAVDTGHIPSDEEGWSMLRFDPGLAGWNGPYVDGPIPPLDPFRQPLKYVKVTNPAGRVFGRVYSMWEDRRDQQGVNSSLDRVSLVLYFQQERFRNDPNVNPQP